MRRIRVGQHHAENGNRAATPLSRHQLRARYERAAGIALHFLNADGQRIQRVQDLLAPVGRSRCQRGTHGLGHMAIGQDAKLRVAIELEIRLLRNQGCKVLSVIDATIDQLRQPLATEQMKVRIEHDCRRAARSFERMAPQVHRALAHDVVRMLDDFLRPRRAPEQHHAGTHRHVELFVRIDDDGIGTLDAREAPALALRQQCCAAPCGIHVEMAAGLMSNIRNRVERIDRARLRRPRYADDRHRPDVALLQVTHGVAQQVDAHATVCIDPDRHEIVAPDAKDIGCLSQRVVPALRDDDRKPVMAVMA
ncbi:hypothetical protein D9M68_604420 [compost metagenome]